MSLKTLYDATKMTYVRTFFWIKTKQQVAFLYLYWQHNVENISLLFK